LALASESEQYALADLNRPISVIVLIGHIQMTIEVIA
jgi:hypothetical protein